MVYQNLKSDFNDFLKTLLKPIFTVELINDQHIYHHRF